MKNNLNEQVSRIKDMIKKLNENQFDEIFDRPNDEDTSFERFKESHREELVKLKTSLRKVTPEMVDNLSNEEIEELERTMNTYDENVYSYIDFWVNNPRDFSINDIVRLANENSDKYGTEPQMVLNAIEDYLEFFGISPFEEEDDIPEDPSDGIGYSEDDLERDMVHHNKTGKFHPDSPMNINEQTSPYTVGQVLNAIRSIDNKMYTLKISRVGEGFVGAIITGPGTYEGNDLRKGFHAELYSKTPGQLSGNMEMGEFKIQ